jgi:hypothetical protein
MECSSRQTSDAVAELADILAEDGSQSAKARRARRTLAKLAWAAERVRVGTGLSLGCVHAPWEDDEISARTLSENAVSANSPLDLDPASGPTMVGEP